MPRQVAAQNSSRRQQEQLLRQLDWLFGLVLVGLLALPVLARAEGGPDPATVARLISEMRSHDSQLTPETAAEILTRSDISEENAAIALARLVDERRAKLLAAGGWRLVEPGCPD